MQEAIAREYRTLNPSSDARIFSVSGPASSNVIKLKTKSEYPSDTTDDFEVFRFREDLLLYAIETNKVFITGHFALSDVVLRQLQGDYALITILREPEKRWISSYFYNRHKTSDHRKIGDGIRQHLESPFGQSQGYELVKFLGGVRTEGDYTSVEAVEQAQANLQKFDIVGFLEKQQDFIQRFHKRFCRKLGIGHKNLSPVSQMSQNVLLDDGIRSQIKNVCRPDREVYDYAVKHFL